eukprot:COSAG01_NODE_21057_length_919_cov_1.945189_1_plen_189_part_10
MPNENFDQAAGGAAGGAATKKKPAKAAGGAARGQKPAKAAGGAARGQKPAKAAGGHAKPTEHKEPGAEGDVYIDAETGAEVKHTGELSAKQWKRSARVGYHQFKPGFLDKKTDDKLATKLPKACFRGLSKEQAEELNKCDLCGEKAFLTKRGTVKGTLTSRITAAKERRGGYDLASMMQQAALYCAEAK